MISPERAAQNGDRLRGLVLADTAARVGTAAKWQERIDGVLDEFSYRSRTIYPFRRPAEKNPCISVTYFCVPRRVADEIGIGRDGGLRAFPHPGSPREG